MADQMSPEDYEIYRLLRERSALVPIEDALLNTGGWFIVGCEDGDRTPEAAAHLRRKLNLLNGGVTCTQLLYITGGPASASPACPFFNLTYKGKVVGQGDQTLFARIEKGLIAKRGRLTNFGYQPHCACGMCSEAGMTLWDNLYNSFVCKDLVRGEFTGMFAYHGVLPHFDLTGYRDTDGRQGSRFRTYHCDRRAFERLWQQRTSQTHDRKSERLEAAAAV